MRKKKKKTTCNRIFHTSLRNSRINLRLSMHSAVIDKSNEVEIITYSDFGKFYYRNARRAHFIDEKIRANENDIRKTSLPVATTYCDILRHSGIICTTEMTVLFLLFPTATPVFSYSNAKNSLPNV